MVNAAKIALLLALCFTIFVVTSGARFPSNYADRAWDDACRLSEYNCKGIERPTIFVTPRTRAWHSAIGVYYMSTHTVFLDSSMDPATDKFAYAILVHEMTHYLQWMNFGWGHPVNDKFIGCMAEQEAFRVSNALLVEMGLAERGYWDWSERYGCSVPLSEPPLPGEDYLAFLVKHGKQEESTIASHAGEHDGRRDSLDGSAPEA